MIALLKIPSAYQYFQRGNFLPASLSLTVAGILIFLAHRLYTETWSIEENDRIFTIKRNDKVHFQGRRINITTVSRNNGAYGISHRNGKTIYVPKKAANAALLKLIGQ